MKNIYAIDGIVPVVDQSAFIHPTAVLIGDVIIGPNVYVGPLVSLRGDFGRIVMQEGSNIQDSCVVHGTAKQDTIVMKNGHIGHGAILHGCVIEENALVGMNAVVMDRAVVGRESIVAAMAFVKRDFIVPSRTLVAGSPAKVIKELTDEAVERKTFGTRMYQRLAQRCLASLEQVEPLRHVEENRPRLQPEQIYP